MNIRMNAALAIFFFLMCSSFSLADIITIEGVVKSVDTEKRTITVEFEVKERMFEIANKAKISVEGKAIPLGQVKPGQKAVLSYHDKLEMVLAIAVKAVKSPINSTLLDKPLLGHKDYVGTVFFSPDGTLLASGSHDKTFKIWSMETGKETVSSGYLPEKVAKLAFTPDGNRIAAICGNGMTYIFDAMSGEQISGHELRSVSLVWDDRSDCLISADVEGAVRLWSTIRNKEVLSFNLDRSIRSLEISPNGQVLAVAGKNSVTLYAVANLKQQVARLPVEGIALSLAFTPDGKTLAATVSGQGIVVWDLSNKQIKQMIGSEWFLPHSLRMAPDGKTVAVSVTTQTATGQQDEIKIVNLETGNETGTLITVPKPNPAPPFLGFDFSSDGAFLAVGCIDGSIKFIPID